MGLHIPDYEQHYGKRKGRKNQFAKGIPSIMVPTGTNAKYRKLIQSKGGPKAFTVWVQLLCYWGDQVATKWATGGLWGADGMATIEEIATARHLKPQLVKEAVAKLLELGWLEESQPADAQLGNNWATTGQPSKAKQREEKLSKEKQREEKKPPPPYLNFPEMQFIKLTQDRYDKLCAKWGKSAVDDMLSDLNVWLHDNPKKRATRDCYLTLGNWLKREAKKQAGGKLGVDQHEPGNYAGIAKKAPK